MYSVIWNQFTQRLWNDHTLIIHTHPGPMGLRVPPAQNSLIFAVQGAGKAQGQTYEPQIGSPTKTPKKCDENDVFFLNDWTSPPRPTPPPNKQSHQTTMYLDHHPKLLFLLLKVTFLLIFLIYFWCRRCHQVHHWASPQCPNPTAFHFGRPQRNSLQIVLVAVKKNKMVTLFHVDVTVVGDLE